MKCHIDLGNCAVNHHTQSYGTEIVLEINELVRIQGKNFDNNKIVVH